MHERMERNRRMSRYFKTAMLFLLVLGLWCAQAWSGNVLTQISTIDALLAGAYDGHVTIGELKAFGDLGIGTFHALD
jgi:acetolactate decarboxylase